MRAYLVMVILMLPFSVISQTIIGGGFVFSSLENNKPDIVIDKYNELRPWLNDRLKSPNRLVGLGAECGNFYDVLCFGVSWISGFDYQKLDETHNSTRTNDFIDHTYDDPGNFGVNVLICFMPDNIVNQKKKK